MTTFHPIRHALVAAATLLMLGGAQAENFSKAVYNGARDDVKVDYKLAKENCDALAGNAKDGCVASAKARYNEPW